MPATPIAVAVVVRERMVLVGRRHALAREGPGLDEFPGGKVEPGETPALAAARECLEETGLRVTIGRLIDVAEGSASFGPIEVSFFLAEPSEPEGHPRPVSPFEWLPVASLATKTFPATNARVVGLLMGDAGALDEPVGQGGS